MQYQHGVTQKIAVIGGGANVELAARGELGTKMNALIKDGSVTVGTNVYLQFISSNEQGIILKTKESKLGGFDRLIVNTGSRPNVDFLLELRFDAEAITEAVPALAPLIDLNLHSCGTVDAHGEKELRQPEPNFYIVGSKCYCRAPTFLMATFVW